MEEQAAFSHLLEEARALGICLQQLPRLPRAGPAARWIRRRTCTSQRLKQRRKHLSESEKDELDPSLCARLTRLK